MRIYNIKAKRMEHAVVTFSYDSDRLTRDMFRNMLQMMFEYACTNCDYDDLRLLNGKGEELARMVTREIRDPYSSKIVTTLYISGIGATRTMVVAE